MLSIISTTVMTSSLDSFVLFDHMYVVEFVVLIGPRTGCDKTEAEMNLKYTPGCILPKIPSMTSGLTLRRQSYMRRVTITKHCDRKLPILNNWWRCVILDSLIATKHCLSFIHGYRNSSPSLTKCSMGTMRSRV